MKSLINHKLFLYVPINNLGRNGRGGGVRLEPVGPRWSCRVEQRNELADAFRAKNIIAEFKKNNNRGDVQVNL